MVGNPAVTLEVGPRRRIDAHSVDVCMAAVEGVLGLMGLMECSSTVHPSRVCTGGWRREWPTYKSCGSTGSVGWSWAVFERRQVLAEIHSLEGSCVERLRASGRLHCGLA